MRDFSFFIDRGGTFTDIFSHTPKGPKVLKLLSSSPEYTDAPSEGIRRILQECTGGPFPQNEPLDTSRISSIRMGTTVATNALLERKGAASVLVVTKGFEDLLSIADQSRPDLFDLEVRKPELLHQKVVQAEERVQVVRENASTEEITRLASLCPSQIRETSSGTKIIILQPLQIEPLRQQLKNVYSKGIRSIAVALMHSYLFPEHERLIGRIAEEIGFQYISLSSSLLPMIKIVPRAFTASADAYLSPCIQTYLFAFASGFDSGLEQVHLSFMQSDGGLVPVESFVGSKAVLSGPAGGVVGYSKTCEQFVGNTVPIIGFDMGGTSTDVSRYHKAFEHVFETVIDGITLKAPQLDIRTVAAGGGSQLFYELGMFKVGPESAGAFPGPACYRNGGPLTVTDANLVLGRLQEDFFPSIFGPEKNDQLSLKTVVELFEEMKSRIGGRSMEEIAMGFIRVANETMCRPIRNLTQSRGFHTANHLLSCFGGAGGQHACAIARSLGIGKVFVHRYSGILSAYGLGLAEMVQEEQEPCSFKCSQESFHEMEQRFDRLEVKVREKLRALGFECSGIVIEMYLNLRYDGTDNALMIESPIETSCDRFREHYQREFGFVLERPIVVDDLRVRGRGLCNITEESDIDTKENGDPICNRKVFFESKGWMDTPVYKWNDLAAHQTIEGPALLIDDTSTILLEPECSASVSIKGHICIEIGEEQKQRDDDDDQCDPVLLSIFGHRFMSIAEQMGKTLQRTSISTNIKERLDFSCAVFSSDGSLVANAPHIPVHLGAMQEAVKFQRQLLGSGWKSNDVILSNHPQAGGSHLPDITVMSVVCGDNDEPLFYVANRGHHADIGGISPGSMPPFSKSLEEEGAAIKSFKLVKNGVLDEDGISKLLLYPKSGFPGTRCLKDNLSDLKAQVAANQKGKSLLSDLIHEYGLRRVQAYMHFICLNAEQAVREMLIQTSLNKNLTPILTAKDHMDDGTVIQLTVRIDSRSGSATFDFNGSGMQNFGNLNAPKSVTLSAILYCLRCMIRKQVPLNQGCMNPITVIFPDHSILNPSEDAAVVAGNVLTSQRVTDVVLKAFEACAASQGCTNNFTFGDESFGYYETIAGGAGAGDSWNGQSGVHTHMTNTRITDPEILEKRYPVILRTFQLRNGSGGNGKFKGGEGVVREIEFLKHLDVGILSERRVLQPYGMKGGLPGACGENSLFLAKDGISVHLGGKNAFKVSPGDIIRICTPGGGGFGKSVYPS